MSSRSPRGAPTSLPGPPEGSPSTAPGPWDEREARRGGRHGGRAVLRLSCRVDLCWSRRRRDGVAFTPRRAKVPVGPWSCRPVEGAPPRVRGTSGLPGRPLIVEGATGRHHDHPAAHQRPSRVPQRRPHQRRRVPGPWDEREARRGGRHGGRAVSRLSCRVDLCWLRRRRDGVAFAPRRAKVPVVPWSCRPVEGAAPWARGTIGLPG